MASRKKDSRFEEIHEGPIRLDILSTVKKQQLMNGLRTKDYRRYRKFCAKKLARIRKQAKTLRKRQRQTDFNNEVWIGLLMVERAWALAQELEFQMDDDVDEYDAEVIQRRRNIHASKRLHKAEVLARQFLDTLNGSCDLITMLDAEGYYQWIAGESSRRTETYEQAYLHYGQFMAVLNLMMEMELRPASFLTEKIEEVTVRMQLCEQMVSGEDRADLDSRIDAFQQKQEENREELAKEKDSQAVGVLISTLDFLGTQIFLTEKYAQDVFREIQTTTDKLQGCSDPKKKASIHLKLMHAFFVVQNDPKLTKNSNIVEYSQFYYFVHNIRRYWTILTQLAEQCSPSELEDKWKEYKTIIEELSRVTDWSNRCPKVATEIVVHDSFSELMKAYVVGQSHLEAGNHVNAFSIGCYTERESRQLLKQTSDLGFEFLPELRDTLSELCAKCSRQRIFGKTGFVIARENEQEEMENRMEKMSLGKQKRTLQQRKFDFRAGNPETQYDMVEFPLKMETLLPNPCFLDCARLNMYFPDLDDRLEEIQEQNSGWLSSIWG